MKPFITCCLILYTSSAHAEEWKPPAKPDPSAILSEADDDTRARHFDTALAKYVWFHDNALLYQPSLSGVRLSFALSGWGRLADSYPPALAKMKEVRDRLKTHLQQAERVAFEDFQDLAALDRELDDESATIETFRLLDKRSPKTAQRMFRLAEPALVRAKEYAICGKHIDSERATEEIVRMLHLDQATKKNGQKNPRLQDYTEKRFISASALLVSLLVVNDRMPEAEMVASELKKAPTDPKLLAKLDTELAKALRGVVPPPWP